VKNGQNILIIALLALLLGSLGGVYYLNQKYNEAKTASLQNVAVFVSDKNISAQQQIAETDIKQINLPKSAVNFRVLTKQEIIGKYAKAPIYHNEPMIEEKLSAKLQAITDANLTAVKDKFNMRFVLFQNPNFNLKKGDKIDIIGVYKNAEGNDFQVEYAARSIKVIDFFKGGISQEKPAYKIENAKDKNVPQYIFAEEMMLDMNSAEIAKTLALMNKNHMLWMVLSGENRNDEALVQIRTLVAQKTPPKLFTSPSTTSKKDADSASDAPMVIYESTSKVADKK
jgi:hypothetical protein